MGLLDGKTAIVTGAARGIGKAIALKFASEGANIAFTDLVIDENAENTAKEIEAMGVKAKGYASNAANFEDTAKVVEAIHADFGRIDILVNNAGITRDGMPRFRQIELTGGLQSCLLLCLPSKILHYQHCKMFHGYVRFLFYFI